MKWIWIFMLGLWSATCNSSCMMERRPSAKSPLLAGQAATPPETTPTIDTTPPPNAESTLEEEASAMAVSQAMPSRKQPARSGKKADKSPASAQPQPAPPHREEFPVGPPIDTVPYGPPSIYYANIFKDNQAHLSDGFDFPVGKPNMRGYYIAQKFQQNRHLGDDFNAVTGGNTDLGDPVYAIANGFVSFSHDLKGGWGNTLRIVHRYPEGKMVESLYSHLDEMYVGFGQFVKRGELIGTIGTAHGIYPAHLHLEMRTQVNMPLGRGYSDNNKGYTAPTPFIRVNRPR